MTVQLYKVRGGAQEGPCDECGRPIRMGDIAYSVRSYWFACSPECMAKIKEWAERGIQRSR